MKKILLIVFVFIGINLNAQSSTCMIEQWAKDFNKSTPEFKKFMGNHPDALVIYDELFKNGSKYVITDGVYLSKLGKLNPEIRKYIVAFTDDKAGSTLAKFLDDCDNSAFREAINNNPILAEAFVGHKKGWRQIDYEIIGEEIAELTSDVASVKKIEDWVNRSSKLANFGEVVRLGREFEELCLIQLKNKSSKVYTELKNKITDLDERTILSGVELCLSGKYPCNRAGEYFKPDFVAVRIIKVDNKDVLDVIIIDSKLSKTAPWTTNQKTAQGINDYVIKSTGKSIQGDLNLTTEKMIQRDNPFVKIFKENEVIKVD